MASPSHTRLHRNQSSSSRSKTLLLENDAMRLQRTADTFTIKLEHERRKDILLNEQIRLQEEELKRRKQASLGGTTGDERRLKQKIAALSHELELVSTSISDTQTYNRSLRDQIEGYRMEHCNYRAAIKGFTEELEELTKTQWGKHTEYVKSSTSTTRLKTSMARLRSKSVNERAKQQARIQELAVIFTQEAVREDLNAKSSFFRTLEDNFKSQIKRTVEMVDPIPIQNALLRKWKDVSFYIEAPQCKVEIRRLRAVHKVPGRSVSYYRNSDRGQQHR